MTKDFSICQNDKCIAYKDNSCKRATMYKELKESRKISYYQSFIVNNENIHPCGVFINNFGENNGHNSRT